MHLAGYVARAGHRPGQVPPGRKATPRPLTRLLRPLTAFTKSSRRRPGQAVLMLSSRSAMHSRGQSAASGNIVCISIYMCTLSPSSNSSSPAIAAQLRAFIRSTSTWVVPCRQAINYKQKYMAVDYMQTPPICRQSAGPGVGA